MLKKNSKEITSITDKEHGKVKPLKNKNAWFYDHLFEGVF
jgi:hypothetical protein